MDFSDYARDERRLTIAHECGHATAAWLSPFVSDVEYMRIGDGPGITKIHYLVGDTVDTHAEKIVIYLAGMAGEGIVWGKIRSRASQQDLVEARESAEKLLRLTTIESLRRWWRVGIDSKVNVAAMFSEPPPAEIGEALNLGYRRARARLVEYRAGFTRLCVLAVGKSVVTREEIQSQFGPRPWAPGRK